MSELTGEHALVTGANRGIGAAIATTLSAAGAAVTLLVRDRAAGDAMAERLPGRAQVVVASVIDAEAVRQAIEHAASGFGPVSLCINNAGVAESAPFTHSHADLWHRILNVNLMGTVHVTQAVLPGMLTAQYGRVIMIASTAGLTGYPYVSAYVAAKHAVVGLVRALARETATRGVTVNAVCPGFTDTDLVAESVSRIVAVTGRTPQEARSVLTASNPQGRLVRPEEVADAVLWLCGRGASAVTGQAIAVAGGEVG